MLKNKMMQEKRQYNLPFQECNINENTMFKMLKCWHAKKEKSTCKYMQKYEHAERKNKFLHEIGIVIRQQNWT